MHERPFWNPFCVLCNKQFWVIQQFFLQDIGVYLVAGVKNTNSSVIFRVSSVTFLNYCDYVIHLQAVTPSAHHFYPILTKIRMRQHFVMQPQWNSFSSSQAVKLKLTHALREFLLCTHQQWITFSFRTYNYHLKWDAHLLQRLFTVGVPLTWPCGETFWVHHTAPVHNCCLMCRWYGGWRGTICIVQPCSEHDHMLHELDQLFLPQHYK
jgi:hypothetical protein